MACRLCLALLGDSSNTAITAASSVYPMVVTVFPKIDLKITQKPFICENCVVAVRKYSEFKKTVLRNEAKIKSYASGTLGMIRLDDVLTHYNIPIGQGSCDACRICLKTVELKSKVTLVSFAPYVDIIKSFFPGINIASVQDPVFCVECVETLKEFHDFQGNCSDVQNKLKNHLTTGQVLLYDDLVAIALKHCGEKFLDDGDTSTKSDIPKVKAEKLDTEPVLDEKEFVNSNTEDNIQSEVKEKLNENKPEDEEKEEIFRCPHCIYSSLVEESIARHMKYKHKIYEEELQYKCKYCPAQSDRSYEMKRHMSFKHGKPKKQKTT